MDTPNDSLLDALQSRIDHVFIDKRYLYQALTHRSYLADHAEVTVSNQRLEFLGDAVLQLIMTDLLYKLYPGEQEGGLSKRRASLTNGAFLVEVAKEAKIDASIRLGSSEEASGGRVRASSLEDACEALIGAVYLDGGIEAAKKTVIALYGDLTQRLEGSSARDNPKGRLQEIIQPIHGNHALRYEVILEEGEDHAKAFEVAVYLIDKEIGRGRGHSKKIAEEAAARIALTVFNIT
jgi:ribonuclease-3